MLRTAVVGLGWWGTILVRTITGSDKLRVVRAVEPNAATAREVAAECGVPVTARYEDALADDSVDAVILATPHSLHEAQAVSAARAGKHVFVEKPLGLTLESALNIVRACRAARVVLAVGHERRFEPPQVELARLLTAGELGTPLQVEANFSHDKFLALAPGNWRLSAAEAPSGGMTATGIHLLDLAIALLGTPASVYAPCATLASALPNGDSLSLLVRFESGATATINVMLATPFVSRFALYGSRGWVEIRDQAHVEAPQGWRLTRNGASGEPVHTDYPVARPVLANLEAFADAVAGRDQYPISPRAMLLTVAALEATFHSSASGRIEPVARVPEGP
ncbi:MAG TPA: Gfo/Idh/MocA family oxidoreductase [Burkholderiales bacterium]|nr:Gfo/Idh/MocA family oxidoreductase [Burkholderiales bacterium]